MSETIAVIGLGNMGTQIAAICCELGLLEHVEGDDEPPADS
ncbi:MAG: hypothetical protein ACLQUY_01515 [Ktedonobacterales bacterium]